jgi:type IV pilus assembly protein PilO
MKTAIDITNIRKQATRVKRLHKIIIIVCLNIAIFLIAFFYLIRPQIDTKKELAGQLREVKQELDKLVQIKNNMDKYRKDYVQLRDVLDQTLRQLPESKDIPNLLRNVSAIGSESRVKITYFEPGALQPKEFYGEFSFKVRYRGPFHNLGYFFDGVRRIERIIDVTDFSLVSSGPPTKIVLEGECLAKSYVYMREQPKQQKGAKGGTAPKK